MAWSAIQKDFLQINFLEGIIRYKPFIRQVRLSWTLKGGLAIISSLFVNYPTAQKLKFLCQYLLSANRPAEITFIMRGAKRLSVLITININDFPVTGFAKAFKIERLIEKEIDQMDVAVNSMAKIKVIHNDFYDWLKGPEPKCHLSINSLDPYDGQLIEPDHISVPAAVVSAGQAM